MEELHPKRSLSRSPLFQVMFDYLNTLGHTAELAGLRTSRFELSLDTAMFDLILYMSEGEDGTIGCTLEDNTDLFDAATIRRMMGHLRKLLEGIPTDPNRSIGELPILTESERHQLLVEWNDTRTDYPRDACIHHLFEAQVEKTPDAIAVTFGKEQLTYRELNRRANQLAHSLQRLGVGPDVLVGICVERSLEMVVGLLGILKAGGAYVPIDPDLSTRTPCLHPQRYALPSVINTGPAEGETAGAPGPGDLPGSNKQRSERPEPAQPDHG